MSTALMVRNDALRSAWYTDTAIARRDEALAAGALIGRVSNPEEQVAAVEAQKAIRATIKEIEDARKACKEPILDFGRQIDACAAKFRVDLEREEIRVATLVGNYQQAEIAKAKAAEAVRLKELAELERKRQEELAKAKTLEERDAINTRADEDAKAAKPEIVPARVKGQIVREEWVIRSIREWELAKARPDLVRKIEFDMIAIKALLNAGEKLQGVVAEREIVSTVRAGRSQIVDV